MGKSLLVVVELGTILLGFGGIERQRCKRYALLVDAL